MPTIENDYLHLALILYEGTASMIDLKIMSKQERRRAAINDTRELILAHRKIHRFAEKDCNVGLNPDDENQVKRIQSRIEMICHPYCITPIFGGDPRGCVVKLKLPDGSTNDWGNEGWCVPR